MMKRIYILVAALCLIIGIQSSCKKTVDKILPTASLTVYNCLADGSTLFTKFNGSEKVSFAHETDGISVPFLGNLNFKNFGLPAGGVLLKLYAFPDSLQAIGSTSLNLKAGDIYSLFISGNKTNADTLITHDEIPSAPVADSLIFIRIIDLAKTGTPVSVNIAGEPPIPGMLNLSYKVVSKFVTIGVKKAQHSTNSIVFEVRGAVDKQLLSSFVYNWNLPLSTGGGSNYLSKATTVIILDTNAGIQCNVNTPVIAF